MLKYNTMKSINTSDILWNVKDSDKNKIHNIENTGDLDFWYCITIAKEKIPNIVTVILSDMISMVSQITMGFKIRPETKRILRNLLLNKILDMSIEPANINE